MPHAHSALIRKNRAPLLQATILIIPFRISALHYLNTQEKTLISVVGYRLSVKKSCGSHRNDVHHNTSLSLKTEPKTDNYSALFLTADR